MKPVTHVSNSSLKLLDNSAVVQFLSQIGSNLVDNGLLDRSDIEEFRIILQQTKSLTGDVNAPFPLVKLAGQSLNMMSAITEHFGSVGFSRNLLRYTMRESSRHLSGVLRDLIALTVEQSALMFNRPFALFLDQECDRLTLFSTPLLEIGEACESSLGIIDIAVKEISRLIPSDFPSDNSNRQEIDSRIAASLGFSIDASTGNSLTTEALSSDLVFVAVRHVGKAVGAFADQLRWNLAADTTGKLRLACEFLINQSLTSSTFRDSGSSDLQTWEHKRQHWIDALHHVVKGLDDIRSALRECLNAKTNVKAPEVAVLAKNIGRMVSADLMKAGVNAVRAQQASRDLLDYCKKQKVRPSQVIPGELSKINPALNASALKVLQSTDKDQALLFATVNEKAENFKTMERLKSVIAGFFVVVGFAAASSFQLVGCGWKTDPRGLLQDPQPSIPYKPQPLATPAPQPMEEP